MLQCDRSQLGTWYFYSKICLIFSHTIQQLFYMILQHLHRFKLIFWYINYVCISNNIWCICFHIFLTIKCIWLFNNNHIQKTNVEQNFLSSMRKKLILETINHIILLKKVWMLCSAVINLVYVHDIVIYNRYRTKSR